MDEQGGWGDFFYPRLKTCPYARNITCSIVALTSKMSDVYVVGFQYSAECFKEHFTCRLIYNPESQQLFFDISLIYIAYGDGKLFVVACICMGFRLQ
jgi:phage terminase large subunit-like protein